MNHNDRRVPDGTAKRPYVERRIDFGLFSTELRQALIAVEPAFFGWDAAQQDRWRRDIPDAVLAKIDQYLQAAPSRYPDASPHRLDALNTLKLPLLGIGADCFMLNEPGDGWYDAETIADLSHDHYRSDPEREECRLPFMGQFFPIWCRYLRRDRLVYATLTAFHHHVADDISQCHDELVDMLIPSRFVEGPDHGKKAEGGYLWDMKRDANGLEGQLDALIERGWKIQNELYLRALEDCHARNSGRVFRVVRSDGAESMTTWVFDGIESMRNVRLTRFLADVHAHRASRQILVQQVRPWRDEAANRLRQAHADIMRNWNPKIARLKPKRRVVLSDQAASDLLDE